MNSTDPTQEREKRISDLLKTIGGLEESIRIAIENGDSEFIKELKPLKIKYYQKLRRVIYDLPERTSGSDKDS